MSWPSGSCACSECTVLTHPREAKWLCGCGLQANLLQGLCIVLFLGPDQLLERPYLWSVQSCGQTCDALPSAPKWRCLAEAALKNPVSTPKVTGCIRQESIGALDSIVKCLDFAARRFRRVWAARATSDHASLTGAWKAASSFDSCNRLPVQALHVRPLAHTRHPGQGLMAPASEQEMQKELDKFKGMQEGLQKDYEARMGLIAQQQETELVKQEFDSIEEDAVVYKLVGPVMVKQNVDDAKANVAKRLEYISGELDRSNKIIGEKEKELSDKQKQLIKSVPANHVGHVKTEDKHSIAFLLQGVMKAVQLTAAIFLATIATFFMAGQEAPIDFVSARWIGGPVARSPGPRTACRAEVQESEDLEEEDEAPDVDLDKDPNWLKVKQEMARIWDMRYESEDWLIADDVKGIMDEHLQTIVGRKNYLDMEETFVEVADEEPKPGEISKEDFTEAIYWHRRCRGIPVLPILLLGVALAIATTCFVGGTHSTSTSLRGGSPTARGAVPETLELSSSVTTALEVSTPGWWANIVLLVVPCAILIIIYLQSERQKFEEATQK
ncbi:YKE2 [Symbiodinium sp. CCMP2592]|nr:YKE2 [Symbiodinium sp. CCMP2592]